MSNRNSQQNKQAARERLRAERERQAKKDKTRRQLVVGGSVVAVLAVAAGIGVAATQLGGSGSKSSNSSWDAAAKQTLVEPANTAGKGGTDITVGDPKAKHTLEIYQDMRCPICSVFEQNVGGEIQKNVKDGTYKVTYHIGTFLDKNMGGTGAKNALSAVGAAVNVSPEAFVAYNQALYSKTNHPEETQDKFADDDYLLKIAQEVPALKDNAEFKKNVTKGTFDKWALNVSDKFDAAKDVTGTPTLKFDGKKLTKGQGVPMTPADFESAIKEHL
ncbi:thioredoxin domain-containing protein [Streptomyces sp. NPDC050610]|uniref:thioredoxin domain-containing protein n=1 Tax=Streptomyces sp. NPDC050610 TaxID=3157097 RepID=UPI0034434E19